MIRMKVCKHHRFDSIKRCRPLAETSDAAVTYIDHKKSFTRLHQHTGFCARGIRNRRARAANRGAERIWLIRRISIRRRCGKNSKKSPILYEFESHNAKTREADQRRHDRGLQ